MACSPLVRGASTGRCPEVASNEKEVEFGDFDKDKDLDGDSSVGASDLLLLLVQWGTDPGGPPEFDGDGTVGVSDLLALLINWGPVPASNDYILEVLSRTGP